MLEKELKNFGQRLKIFRNRNGETAESLAKGIDSKTNYMFQVEAERRLPSLRMLSRIAEFYELTLSELLEELYNPLYT